MSRPFSALRCSSSPSSAGMTTNARSAPPSCPVARRRAAPARRRGQGQERLAVVHVFPGQRGQRHALDIQPQVQIGGRRTAQDQPLHVVRERQKERAPQRLDGAVFGRRTHLRGVQVGRNRQVGRPLTVASAVIAVTVQAFSMPVMIGSISVCAMGWQILSLARTDGQLIHAFHNWMNFTSNTSMLN